MIVDAAHYDELLACTGPHLGQGGKSQLCQSAEVGANRDTDDAQITKDACSSLQGESFRVPAGGAQQRDVRRLH
ncbi:hypothetical protein G6F58_013681 [Rhizopus delemar]|nr:hypothetical protein G6F58_013681 [Rhizopus delemar]